MFVVNKVSQFMHKSTTLHWVVVKRILRYLKGTLNYGITINASNDFNFHAFSDSDWAGCPNDRRSTTAYLIFLGPNLIFWCSKKQPTVARFSTEAEYRSLAMASAETIWLQSLLKELGYNTSPPTLWCDNLGATFLASNSVFHARTKYIELDYHFVREKVAAGLLRVHFICSQDQLADALMKHLSSTRFLLLIPKLIVHAVTVGFRGGGCINNNTEITEDMDHDIQEVT
jgi:hypothetical protein